jgi:hypothetical protein
MTKSTVTEHDGHLLARYETPEMVFEVNCETVEVTDVTLEFLRDGEVIGAIYNDHGTEKTMAHLSTPADGDFIGVEVPKSFVRDLLDAAVDTDRVTGSDPEAYALRMLD